MSSVDVHHEIACQLVLAGVSREDVVDRYGAELVESGIRDIEFMCKCLRAERQALSRHSNLFESARRTAGDGVMKASSDFDSLQIFLLFAERWYPEDMLHLLYLKWRNSANSEYYEYAEELSNKVQVAEAKEAFESVLSRARSDRYLSANRIE